MTSPISAPAVDLRGLALDLVAAVAAAAVAGRRQLGSAGAVVDAVAVDALRAALAGIELDGVVIATEGAKDRAPMLHHGEHVGTGRGPAVDVAVDPIDGTALVVAGRPGAVSVLAVTARGAMPDFREQHYVAKLAAGAGAGDLDIDAPIGDTLAVLARRRGCRVSELTVAVLDRPRHVTLAADVRRAGARLELFEGGDIVPAVRVAVENGGVDLLAGVGGATEAMLTAAALRALGGVFWCRELASGRVHDARALVGDDVLFVAAGVTDGALLAGVEDRGETAIVDVLVLGTQQAPARIRTVSPARRGSLPSSIGGRV